MFWLNLRQALRGLAANKLRSFLTMLGIIIGVGAVIALIALGAGANAAIAAEFTALGANQLTIMPRSDFVEVFQTGSSSFARMMRQRTTLTLNDLEALEKLGSSLDQIIPIYENPATLVVGKKSMPARARGVTPDYLRVSHVAVGSGRFIQPQDVEQRARVVVLSTDLAQELFGKQNLPAVGNSVRIQRQVYTVIGVLGAGASGFQEPNFQTVYMPLNTAQVKLGGAGTRSLTSIIVTTRPGYTAQFAQAQVRSILRAAHRLSADQKDDFFFINQREIQRAVQRTTAILTMLLSSIAAISLLVGGIGIMNIMLVSVTERTREIGLRKALGATRGNILAQFLTESIILTLLGGGIGLGVGYGLAEGAAFLFGRLVAGADPFNAVITPGAVALALGVSIAIGLFFGLWPANRAAGMRPIDALRYE